MSAAGLKRLEALDPLDAELQVVVSHMIWMLGTESNSSARAIWPLSPDTDAPLYPILFHLENASGLCLTVASLEGIGKIFLHIGSPL